MKERTHEMVFMKEWDWLVGRSFALLRSLSRGIVSQPFTHSFINMWALCVMHGDRTRSFT